MAYQGSSIGTIEAVDGNGRLDILGGSSGGIGADGSAGEGPLRSRSSD